MQTERCLDDGIGPEVFDCAGFVIRAVGESTGVDLLAETGARHVRDMWQSAESADGLFAMSHEPEVGKLLITSRTYMIGGSRRTIPGHIGIVTGVSGGVPRIIHASPKLGRVEERQLRTMSTTLGYLSLRLT